MDNNALSNFLLTLACVMVLFLGFVAVLAFVIVRRLQRFASPDIAELQKQLVQLQAAHPNVNTEAHLRTIIQRQSFKCGIVGALAGLGGFVTLPIALPIDMLLSLQIQAAMVQFIAATYAQTPANSTAQKLQLALITSGSVRVTESAFNVIIKFALRILGKSLSILIPVIGFIVGFGVNYAIAQATGQAALGWYSRTSPHHQLTTMVSGD